MKGAGAPLMRCGRLAVIAFLFLLTGLALASGQSRTGVGPAQVDQEQEKLCQTCHSPRFPPNDTSHDHWVYGYDVHVDTSPCYLCHGDYMLTFNDIYLDTHNPSNIQHPTWDEAAAVGKSDSDCGACHYPHNIREELQAGSITAPTPPYGPTLATWAFMVIAGISLITGASVIGVLFIARKRSVRRGGN